MKKLFGLDFYDKNIHFLVEELSNCINVNRKVAVFTPNVDHIINNSLDETVASVYSQGEYIIADGWPLVAISKFLKKPITRITGVDLMDQLLRIADEQGLSIYFLGSTDSTLKLLKENIEKNYSNIPRVNTHNGFFEDDISVIEEINKSNSQILFVGMGNPKQEVWIKRYMDELHINVAIGVGGAFNIFSEEVSRAPRWVQSLGMEWFYRFLKEPKRLFHRYFIKYPKFIKIAYKELKIK